MGMLQPQGPLDSAGGQAIAQAWLAQQQQNSPQQLGALAAQLQQTKALSDYRNAVVGLKQQEAATKASNLEALAADPNLQQGGIGQTLARLTGADVDSGVSTKLLGNIFDKQDQEQMALHRTNFTNAFQNAMSNPKPNGTPKTPEEAMTETLSMLGKDPESLKNMSKVLGGSVDDLKKISDWATDLAVRHETNLVAPFQFDAMQKITEDAGTGAEAIYRNPVAFLSAYKAKVKESIDEYVMENPQEIPPGQTPETFKRYLMMVNEQSLNNLTNQSTGKKNDEGPFGVFKQLFQIANLGADVLTKNTNVDAMPEKLEIDRKKADAAMYRAQNPAAAVGGAWSPTAVQAKKEMEAFKAGLRPPQPSGSIIIPAQTTKERTLDFSSGMPKERVRTVIDSPGQVQRVYGNQPGQARQSSTLDSLRAKYGKK